MIILLRLKKNIIDKNRYEEYFWVNGNCYSIFRDGIQNYTVCKNNTDIGKFKRKKDAGKCITKLIQNSKSA